MILTSLTDMFKIGPGAVKLTYNWPSAHNVQFYGGNRTVVRCRHGCGSDHRDSSFRQPERNGEGDTTDRAILAGLLGQRTETCDPKLMDELADTSRKYKTTINGKTFEMGSHTIVWDKVDHDYPHTNTVIMRLVGKDGSLILEREYYSPGGGFFQWKGQPAAERGQPSHPYGSMAEFRKLLSESGKSLHEVILENEKAVMHSDEKQIFAHLDLVLKTMEDGVNQGLDEEGLLPGPFQFHRKAKRIYERSANAGPRIVSCSN